MVVGAVQESRFLFFQPALRGQAAALGTTAVFAGVVVNFFDVPVGATSHMSTHLGGPAAHHRRGGLALMQRLWIALAVLVEMFAEYTAYGGFHTGWYPFLLTISLSLCDCRVIRFFFPLRFDGSTGMPSDSILVACSVRQTSPRSGSVQRCAKPTSAAPDALEFRERPSAALGRP